jgi:hypothetical protein
MYRFSATLSTPTVPFTSSGLRALSGEEELGPLVLFFREDNWTTKSAVLGGGHRASRREKGRNATGSLPDCSW